MKFKAIVATSTMVILIPSDGSPVVQVAGANLIPDNDLITMSKNIQEHGETELITSSVTLTTILESMGILVRTEEDGSLTAIVGDVEIEAVDKLKDHIEHSVESGESDNVANLIKRLATVNRKHSVDDLIHFVSKSDMPITKSGLILGYKLLTRTNSGVYDSYTKKVKQNVGSLVSTPIDKVDPCRARTCSNGLHVASLKYMPHYSGNTIVIVAVDPADVYAVPYTEGEKMRVSKYRIVHELSTQDFTKAKKSGADTASVLGNTLSVLLDEHFPSVTENVVINGSYGNDVVITPVATVVPKKTAPVVKRDIKSVKTKIAGNAKVDISKLSASSKLSSCAALFMSEKTINRYMDVLRIKRKQKKSWEALGLKEDTIKALNKFHSANSDIIKGL